MTLNYSTKALFTGSAWLNDVVVHIENDQVIGIDQKEFDANNAIHFIIPALIDLQLYGAGGKLLSEFPEKETIEKIYQSCLEGGTGFFQPTIASQSMDIIYAAIDAVKAYKASGGKGCIGLHLEGPWIHPIKKGAHDVSVIHAPDRKEVASILAYGADAIGMITLAPEVCSPEIIKTIQNAGIVVSAGHTNATYETAMQFFDDGIPVATHLFNAMSSFQHRAPGVVGALFDHPTAMSSIIADGYHVDYSAIRVAKKIMGDRLFCITDAVTEANTGLYQHTLVGDKYESAGTLSGSALTQLQSIKNLVEKVGIPLGEAIRMCTVYPAKVMQNKNITGTIAIHKKANLLCLNEDVAILNSVIHH